jgi:hypothetical protein
VVKLLDGPHKAQVALLDAVEHGHPGTGMAFGDGHDETQVGLDERTPGGPGGIPCCLQHLALIEQRPDERPREGTGLAAEEGAIAGGDQARSEGSPGRTLRTW